MNMFAAIADMLSKNLFREREPLLNVKNVPAMMWKNNSQYFPLLHNLHLRPVRQPNIVLQPADAPATANVHAAIENKESAS